MDPSCATVHDARRSPKWAAFLSAGFEAYNANSNACASRAHEIRAFCVLPGGFSMAGGKLTPTHDIKRRAVAATYASLIDAELYSPKSLRENALSV